MASVSNHLNAVKELDYVILRNEVVNRLVQLRKNKPLFLGKRKLHVYSAVGHSFGSYFEIQSDGTLKMVSSAEVDMKVKSVADFDYVTKDNRLLIDHGGSQKLTTDDIEAYKKQGVSGHDMVKIIVENSTSFHEKTEFSKEKYLRKKQKKYVNIIQMLRPTIRLLTEMYYSQGPLKICNLRVDSLSQMLAFCNVMSGGKYVIIETVMGVLTAAVLERLGLNGCIVQMHLGPFSIYSKQDALKALNLPDTDVQSVIYNIDVQSAMSVLGDVESMDFDAVNADAVDDSPKRLIKVEKEEDIADNDTVVDSPKILLKVEKEDIADNDTVVHSLKRLQRAEKEDHVSKAKAILATKDMDSLLVAVKNHPSNVLPFIDFLAFSRPFAIFSMYQEPLVDCYVTLKSRGDIIQLNITETWLRKYQVLPERTHPCYNMSGNGGFLLTGIKVEPKPHFS